LILQPLIPYTTLSAPKNSLSLAAQTDIGAIWQKH